MTYYARFNPDGTRITSYHSDMHKDIPKDAIEISDEDQQLYANMTHMRDMVTGKPITYVHPAHILKRISNSDIERKIQELEKQQPEAIRDMLLRNDRTTLEKIDAEIATLKSQLVQED